MNPARQAPRVYIFLKQCKHWTRAQCCFPNNKSTSRQSDTEPVKVECWQGGPSVQRGDNSSSLYKLAVNLDSYSSPKKQLPIELPSAPLSFHQSHTICTVRSPAGTSASRACPASRITGCGVGPRSKGASDALTPVLGAPHHVQTLYFAPGLSDMWEKELSSFQMSHIRQPHSSSNNRENTPAGWRCDSPSTGMQEAHTQAGIFPQGLCPHWADHQGASFSAHCSPAPC